MLTSTNQNLFKLWLTLSLVFLSACTITTEKDFIHKETVGLASEALRGQDDIELDEPFIFLPNFREFFWGYPSIILLSKKAIKARIKSATLTAPGGSPTQTLELNSIVRQRVRQRRTTLGEQYASGGIFKGKRVVPTDLLIGKMNLPFTSSKFNTLSPLRLDFEASIDNGAYKKYSFELVYRKRTLPGFITR